MSTEIDILIHNITLLGKQSNNWSLVFKAYEQKDLNYLLKRKEICVKQIFKLTSYLFIATSFRSSVHNHTWNLKFKKPFLFSQ